MTTVSELLAQKAEIEQKIAEAQRTQRAEAISKVRALMERLPYENIVYFGDTARVPYGV